MGGSGNDVVKTGIGLGGVGQQGGKMGQDGRMGMMRMGWRPGVWDGRKVE